LETAIQLNENSIDALRNRIEGQVFLPDETYYHAYAKAWNLNATQSPAAVVVPTSVADVVAAVRFANEQNLGIGVMATGHGVGKPCNGGLLINTSLMRNVEIDASTQRAKVEAGTLWKDVIAAACEYGLASLAGSAPHVGVVGYTMGGGFGYLGRKYGLNASSVTAAEIVTADGSVVYADEYKNADVFWGIKGGGGNFGIVTSLEFRLYPIQSVYAGAVFYPMEHGRALLDAFAEWTQAIPDEITPAFAFMNVPDIPAAPPALRGRSVIAVKGCYCGEKPEAGEQLFMPMRKLFTPVADTFRIMPVAEMHTISNDPVDPIPIVQYGTMIRDLSSQTMDALVAVAGADSLSPMLMVELRKLGGALNGHSNEMNLMGDGQAQFSLNAIGATFTPVMAEKVATHLRRLKNAIRPYATDEVFSNFMEVDPSAERVRNAYTTPDWQKLMALKAKVDPTNLFRFNRNIPVL
jgi:hypothetical protein